jgi:hypothetical protein
MRRYLPLAGLLVDIRAELMEIAGLKVLQTIGEESVRPPRTHRTEQ